jgi:deoxycytidine triphosphate deaminase
MRSAAWWRAMSSRCARIPSPCGSLDQCCVILSLPEIRAAVAAGEIKFDPPLEDKQWGGASIDLRLGNQFTKLQEIPGMKLSIHEGLGKISGFWRTKELQIKDEFGKLNTFCLDPGEFVLAMTHESLTVPRNLIGLVEGRSTYARLGLSMHHRAVDSAGLVRPDRPRNQEPRSCESRVDTATRSSVPDSVLSANEPAARNACLRQPRL